VRGDAFGHLVVPRFGGRDDDDRAPARAREPDGQRGLAAARTAEQERQGHQ
jgi:hypothetical protein